MTLDGSLRKRPFLIGVFLIAFSSLVFQILQTRILSVIAWYYLAFFAISVAMLGMTVGAVWVYLRRAQLQAATLPETLSRFALFAAVAMPASVVVQFCLITVTPFSLTTLIAWTLLFVVMAIPYIFSGVVVSLALTRSPFPAGQVYGVDLVGAALGCVAVIGLLNVLPAPTAVVLAGAISAMSAMAFAYSGGDLQARRLKSLPWWRHPGKVMFLLLGLAYFNTMSGIDFRPIMVKGLFEPSNTKGVHEKWNTYSRVEWFPPSVRFPQMWAASPHTPADTAVPTAALNIDGSAGTSIFHYDGTPASIAFLQYDLVSLAYRLPGIHKSAVIGVGGGRDVLTAHYFGVSDITGVELNPIFVNLLTKDPYYKPFSNVTAVPNLKLHVDDARSWFASTHEKFDLVQMSMVDTWAATGAGALSLSENGLYTLEGWRAFLNTINPNGFFTVSRWYGGSDMNETGRMIGLATAALLDSGVKDPKAHLFVACNNNLATLVLAKSPFTDDQLRTLHETVRDGGFTELLAPDHPADSPLLRQIVDSHDSATLNRVLDSTYLNLTAPTDAQPFFFYQLRLFDIPSLLKVIQHSGMSGIASGNLAASLVLMMILGLSIVAVITTILVPLRSAARECTRSLALAGSFYFLLIGMGFMMAEIALLQFFSVYLGHPIYSLGVCLFSLILASGLGSLTSDSLKLSSRGKLLAWGSLVVAYLLVMQVALPSIFQATAGHERVVRVAISLAAILPLGFLLGFGFPTGMRLVEAIDSQPTPWFWGVNGATGVLASVLGVITSISFGINVTMLIAASCYLLVIPAGFALLAQRPHVAPMA